jgi:hypothetical protein
MSVTVNDILKIVVTCVWTDGNIMQNVFNALIDGGGGPFDDEDIVDDCVDYADNLYANFTTDVSALLDGSQVQVYKYDSGDDDWDEVGTGIFTWNPTAAPDQLPRGVAGLVQARTSNPDVQGKKYIGGFTEAAVTDGLFTSNSMTNMIAFAADWVTDFIGSASSAEFNPGVWSPTDLILYLMSESYGANLIPAYQRRRKRGVGA